MVISPALGAFFGPAGGCRFTPTCSVYAADAVREHGAVRGSWLATKRLCRCQPWGGHGHDPVPEKNCPVTETQGLGENTKSGWLRARFGVRRLVAALIARATCRSGRAAQSGSLSNQDALCFQPSHKPSATSVTPLDAVLLGRQVVQAGKAATSRRTPYFQDAAVCRVILNRHLK